MNYYMIILLQCGALLGLPIITIVIGMRLYLRYGPSKKWIRYLLYGFFFAVIGFELAFLGLLFDPDTQGNNLISILRDAGKIGVCAFFVGLVMMPLNGITTKWSDKIFKPWRFFSRKDGKYGRRDF